MLFFEFICVRGLLLERYLRVLCRTWQILLTWMRLQGRAPAKTPLRQHYPP